MEGAGELLGIFIGLLANKKCWQMPWATYLSAVNRIANANLPHSLAILAYNTFVVSCCAFLDQVSHVPAGLIAHERHAACKILKLLGNSLSTNMAANLHRLGMPKPVPSKVLGLASSLRAVARTFKSWRSSLASFEEAAKDLSFSEYVCSLFRGQASGMGLL